MARQLPVVCIFGMQNIQLFSDPEGPSIETRALDCRCFTDDRNLEKILTENRPHVIVTFGKAEDFTNLMSSCFDVRRRWLHYADASDLDTIGRQAFYCYLAICVDKRDEQPLKEGNRPTCR